ncbi:MAG TPA: hypothetical protein VMK83_00385 [Gaiellaceae bacterium]|nr:hypothetical protein [Gaiellaceae bacterium]
MDSDRFADLDRRMEYVELAHDRDVLIREFAIELVLQGTQGAGPPDELLEGRRPEVVREVARTSLRVLRVLAARDEVGERILATLVVLSEEVPPRSQFEATD